MPAVKLTSWFLLMLVSYTLVSLVMPAPRPPGPDAPWFPHPAMRP